MNVSCLFSTPGCCPSKWAASRLILFRCLSFHLFVKTNRANTLHQSSQSLLRYFLLEMCSINRRFGSYSNLSRLSDFWQFGLPEVTLTQPSVSWYIRITILLHKPHLIIRIQWCIHVCLTLMIWNICSRCCLSRDMAPQFIWITWNTTWNKFTCVCLNIDITWTNLTNECIFVKIWHTNP